MKTSCEVKFYRSILINLIFFALFMYLIAFLFLFLLGDERLYLYIFMLVLLSLIYLPFIIHYLIKFIYYKKLQPTYIQEVQLKKIVGSFRPLARFVIEMHIDGEKRIIKTLPIFSFVKGRSRPANTIEDYSCKKALVGYDVKKDIAVVIKTLE